MVTHVRVGMSAALGRRSQKLRPRRGPLGPNGPGRGGGSNSRATARDRDADPRPIAPGYQAPLRNGDLRTQASSQKALVRSVRHCTLGERSEHISSQAAPGEGGKQPALTLASVARRRAPNGVPPDRLVPHDGRVIRRCAANPTTEGRLEPNPECAAATREFGLTTASYAARTCGRGRRPREDGNARACRHERCVRPTVTKAAAAIARRWGRKAGAKRGTRSPNDRRALGRRPESDCAGVPRRLRNGDPRTQASSQRAFARSVRHCTLGERSEHISSQAAPGEGGKQPAHAPANAARRRAPNGVPPDRLVPDDGRVIRRCAADQTTEGRLEPNPECAASMREFGLTTASYAARTCGRGRRPRGDGNARACRHERCVRHPRSRPVRAARTRLRGESLARAAEGR